MNTADLSIAVLNHQEFLVRWEEEIPVSWKYKFFKWILTMFGHGWRLSRSLETCILKYNTSDDEWSLFLKLKGNRWDDLRLGGCSMVVDRERNRLYLYGGSSMVALNLLTKSIIYKAKQDGMDNYKYLNVEGTVHRVGGEYIHHSIWNEAQRDWDERGPIIDNCILQGVSLVYVKSKNALLMIGGRTADDLGNVDETGIWRFQIASSKWEPVEYETNCFFIMTDLQCNLTPDEQKVIIVKSNEIYVLDIQDEDNYRIHQASIQLPAPVQRKYGEYTYQVLMKHKHGNVILITSAWFRKICKAQNSGEVECPMDILRVVDQFVCEEMVHLISGGYFGREIGKHLILHLDDILSSSSCQSNEVKMVQATPLTDRKCVKSPHESLSIKRILRIMSYSCPLVIAYLIASYID